MDIACLTVQLVMAVSYTHLDVYKRQEKGCGVEQSWEQAFAWYRRGAECGDPVSMGNLGWCDKMGQGVEQNWQEAIKWYEQGAQCGDLRSMNNLAYCYERGDCLLYTS